MPHIHTEEELLAFERHWRIQLPSSYRKYLAEHGGGAVTTTRVDLLEDWSYHPEVLAEDYLAQDFPHTEPWNKPELIGYKGWTSPYYSDDLVCGSIRIRSTGCEGHDILIISGSLRSRIWHDDRACTGKGIYPLMALDGQPHDFNSYIREPHWTSIQCEQSVPPKSDRAGG